MKKLVLFFAVAAAVSFAACTNKPAEATEEVVDTVAIENACCDKVACDSCTVECDSCKVACDSCKVACDSCKVAE